MDLFVKLKFAKANKLYYFSTEDATLVDGDFVVVETVVGKELAIVVGKPEPRKNLKFELELKPILRKANNEDIKMFNISEDLNEKASKIFTEKVALHKLNMNLISTQYTLDRTKVLFTYVSDERVDFRELLKELATELKCRIELKQINPREKAQLIGGIGPCGQQLCCTRFLKNIEGVSLNRAKNQMLSINIPKLSGQCNKLMCCLNYEDDYYTEERKKYPPIGTKLTIDKKEYKINSYNILTKMVRIDAEDDITFLSLDEINKLLKKHEQRSK